MITIPVGIGELFDKITILEIKSKMIQNEEKLQNIQKELKLLQDKAKGIKIPYELIIQLKETNLVLWNIEDSIRKKEILQEFDNEFIILARNVYKTNDKRSEIKKRINLFTDSELIEEKSYSDSENFNII